MAGLARWLSLAERLLAARIREELETWLRRAKTDRTVAEHSLDRALGLTEARGMLHELEAWARAGSPCPVYVVSSLFLEDSYRYLVKDPSEDAHYVTGSEFADHRVLERLIGFNKLKRTPGGVVGDPASTQRVLIGLASKGHRLTGWFHSHPGCGPWATVPSGIDRAHQTLLETGEYPAIGAVFSRDGYVRFFSNRVPFTVEVHGKGVRRIDSRVYKLD